MSGGEGGDGSEDMDEPPLFRPSTAAGATGPLAVDAAPAAASTVDHRMTNGAVSTVSSSSSSEHARHVAAVVASTNGSGSANNLSGGWYWRTSGSSGGSSEQDSLLSSYILPSHPHPLDSDVVIFGKEMIGEEDVDVARSDSPLLGFGSDSDEEGGAAAQETHEPDLKIHWRSNSSESIMGFPRTPRPEDMDKAYLKLSLPTPKQILPLRSPPRDRLRYPKKGYRRDLPSGLEDGARHNYASMRSPSSKMVGIYLTISFRLNVGMDRTLIGMHAFFFLGYSTRLRHRHLGTAVRQPQVGRSPRTKRLIRPLPP
jgi:hypothetical protein